MESTLMESTLVESTLMEFTFLVLATVCSFVRACGSIMINYTTLTTPHHTAQLATWPLFTVRSFSSLGHMYPAI